MSDIAVAPAELPDVLTFETTVTLEDELALQMHYWTSPAMQAGRLRRSVILVLIAAGFAPVALALGILVGWVGDRDGPSPGEVFRNLVVDNPGILVATVLAMVGWTAFSVMFRQRLVRPRLRRVLRRTMRTLPGVNPADPQLAYRARVTVDAEGLTARSGAGATLVSWNVLKRWEEVGPRIFVLGAGLSGFCVPIPATDPGAVERFRAILTARFGPKVR